MNWRNPLQETSKLIVWLRQPRHLGALTLFIATALVAFLPLTTHGGWPDGHDDLNWKYRIVTYYYHFLQLDFLPIWSSGDCYTLGSPLPLYYQKLFTYVAAIFLLITSNVKLSALITLVLFSLIGIFGMYKCLRLVTGYWSAVFLAPVIMFMNYTVTDWLIRGAVSEFSALTLVPWLLYWSILFIQSGNFRYSIIWIFSLLFLAHNIIAYFGLILIFLALLIGVYVNKNTISIHSVLFRGSISTLIFALVNSWTFLPMLLISDDYDVSKIQYNYTVDRYFHKLTDYFYDGDYQWGISNESYSVEINFIFWLFLTFGIFTAVYSRLFKKKLTIHPGLRPVLIFLLSGFFILFLLQSHFSLPFYQLVPGAMFIQFPWRLLSFIQAVGILLIGTLLTMNTIPNKLKSAISFLMLISMMAFYKFNWTLKDRQWIWYSEQEVESKVNLGVWGSGGEYIPDVVGVHQNDKNFFESLAKQGCQLEKSDQGTISKESDFSEGIRQHYLVHSQETNVAIFPINYSGLERINMIHEGIDVVGKAYRTPEDPRIRVRIASGETVIAIELPTVSTALSKFFDD